MIIENATPYRKIKDYSVSNESFELLYNLDLDLAFTHPQPNADILPRYYDSPDYISHTDSKRSLFEKIYQIVKNRALKNKLKLINSEAEKGHVLDIGAGTGDFLSLLKTNGWHITGIEPNDKAKKIAISKGITFASSTEKLQTHSFDVITMWHVLEHVPDVQKQISELKRIVKPGGTIFVAVPNFNSFDAHYYGNFWAAYDVPRHLWHFSKTAIDKLFKVQDLKVVKVLPMKFDSFYVSLLSEKYKTGKMNFIKAFFIGLKSNRYGKRNLEYSSHIYVIKNVKTQN